MILSMLEIETLETAHQGPLFAVDVLKVSRPGGAPLRREVVRHPGAVAVVPVLETPAGRQLVLIRNYRVAVEMTLWEVPAGKLEAGEDPVEAAGRELEEETGYRAGNLESMGRFFTSPGFADEIMHVFVATDLSHVGQRLEPGEAIEVEPLPVGRVMNMIDERVIVDGKTLASILMWERLQRGKDL